MNKVIYTLALAYIFSSCSTKKPLTGFQQPTIFVLIEERLQATRLNGWQAEIYYEPLTNSHLLYRNYDVYIVFHPKGVLSRILVPHASQMPKSELMTTDKINGVYFQRGNTKVLIYNYYDVVSAQVKTERTTFEMSNDTLLMEQGKKLLVRVANK